MSYFNTLLILLLYLPCTAQYDSIVVIGPKTLGYKFGKQVYRSELHLDGGKIEYRISKRWNALKISVFNSNGALDYDEYYRIDSSQIGSNLGIDEDYLNNNKIYEKKYKRNTEHEVTWYQTIVDTCIISVNIKKQRIVRIQYKDRIERKYYFSYRMLQLKLKQKYNFIEYVCETEFW